jgi:DNA-binding NtrC family response regulator
MKCNNIKGNEAWRMKTSNDQPLHPLNILIVDDDSTTCQLLELILKQRNCITTSAYNLSDARVKLQEQPTDAVFLDNQLPDGKGIDFINYIKQLSPSIKVILVTGAEIVFTNKSYPDYFLEKPLSKKLIFKIVDSLSENVLK